MENYSGIPRSSEGSSVSRSAFLQAEVKTFRQLTTGSSQPDKAGALSASLETFRVKFLIGPARPPAIKDLEGTELVKC
ncbi:uncharacterized [Tachysurus ichikawai]